MPRQWSLRIAALAGLILGGLSQVDSGEQPAGMSAGESCSAECGEAMPNAEGGIGPTVCDQLFAFDAYCNQLFGDEPFLKPLKGQKYDELTWGVGGEIRYRFMDERNRLRPPGPGHSTYDLWRITPFVEASYGDFISGYLQAIDASMFGLDAPYTMSPIDENRSDILQMWGELKLAETDDGALKYRYGRQFLQYGAQRLLSPLGWGNTYRNFEGHKFIYTNGDWNIDAFAMQSVNAAAGNSLHSQSYDHADQSRWISGVYSTWKGIENNDLDLYYICFDESESSVTLMDGRRHTIGTRLAGKHPVKNGKTLVGTWNWDLEGAWQFGEDNFASAAMRDVQAGMLSANGGYTLEDILWKPGLGGIFYWGSGDKDPTSGDINTFYTMAPLGHAYWGQIDNFSGQNLLDYGVQFSLKPTEKLSVVNQWHYFDLSSASDRIYNIAGAALPGSGDRNVGNELDVVATYTFSKTFNLQLGYLMFFYGDAVNNGPLARNDADQLYLQGTWNF